MLRRCNFLFLNASAAIPKGPAGKKIPSTPRAAVPRAAATTSEAQSSVDPLAEAKLSTDKVRETLEQMSPEQLQALQDKIDKQDSHEEKILESDSLYQMDVSLKSRYTNQGLKVFWSDIDVAPTAPGESTYNVLLDGRRVKAFESMQPLRLPTEEYSLAVAKEYSFQSGQMNKLLMPLTDLASGAQLVSPQNIAPRVDYLMSFFANDNCYFRSAGIAEKQDEMIEPVSEYFTRLVGVQTPRIVGLAHPRFTEAETEQVRQFLHGLNMNQYQIVAFCVCAQFTASVMLPLALFNRIVSVEQALAINRLEEGYNVDQHGQVGGYHDIRETDVRVKISAAAAAWRMTNECSVFPNLVSVKDDAELA